MTERIEVDALAAALRQRNAAGRTIVAIAGPPGAGKSRLAEALAAILNSEKSDTAAVLPMDGFHLDDLVLGPRGLLARKGAPETFDVDGLHHMLLRLRRNRETEVAVPLFDRHLEAARAAARVIPASTRFVIAEGNYLLLDRPPWSALRPLFDVTVMLVEPESMLRQRLIERWESYGLPRSQITAKVENNDLPNGRLVAAASRAADFFVSSATP